VMRIIWYWRYRSVWEEYACICTLYAGR